METKAKWDWDVKTIVGITLLFMGITYLSISIPIGFAPADAGAAIVQAIFIPLGFVLLLVGAVFLIRAARKKHQADQLIADGRYIWATVTDLREIQSVNTFRGHPCVICASYTDAYGQTYYFQSRYVYRKPDPSVLEKPVKVYIQGNQYSTYYADVEPLSPQRKKA